MSEQFEGESLHVGLLTLDKRRLLSPEQTHPALFKGALHDDPGIGFENKARAMLAHQGIVTSSVHVLAPLKDNPARGYLLRESRRIDPSEYGLTTYTQYDLNEFLHNTKAEDVTAHFLRQIIWLMTPGLPEVTTTST